MTRLFCLLFAAFLSALVLSCSAARAESVGIEDAVASALDHSPLVQELEARFQIERAEALEAKVIADPELDAALAVPLASQNSRGDDEIDISLSQRVRASQGALRHRLSRLIEESASEEKEKGILETLVRVRFAFAQAWAVTERMRALRELIPHSRNLSRFVSKGLEIGAYGKGDEALFRAEEARIESDMKSLEADKLRAYAELSRLSGRSFSGATLVAPKLPLAFNENELRARLDGTKLRAQRRARLISEMSQAASDVAARDSFPELRPRLFYSHTNEGVDLLGLGVSFDLPFTGNSAEKLKAEARQVTAKLNLSAKESDSFKTSVLESSAAYGLQLEALHIYETQVLPALRDALSALQKQISSGQGNVFQLWQTFRENATAQERYLELWTKLFSERTELSLLLEEEIER